MRVGVIQGSGLATTAALVWATYYIFIPAVDSLDPLSLFFYPSLAGAALFFAYGFLLKGKVPRPSRRRDYLLPGLGYFASQMLIILSTLSNGGVLTSTFILLGDTIVSPSVIFALGRYRFRPRLRLLLIGLVVLVTSAAMLTLFGGYAATGSAVGILLLILIPPSLSLFFVYTNDRIMADGMAEILASAFLISSLFILVYSAVIRQSYPVAFGDLHSLAVLIIIGLTSMFAGYLLFFKASSLTGFTLSSILMALIPPFTLILGVIFLGISATVESSVLIVLAAVGAGLCTLAFAEGGADSAEPG